ncbi:MULTISPECIES: hypothetical protein [Bacillus subtilis group]|uniref:hypothetical protein n=1 Tax=Bacillus subtilis group TaxID=653685 RepID=UPI00227DE1E5|nr:MULTISPECIES: hypothetical protein [Bacillus subtilis group]MCY9082427.1 hypothetical protein [Bacillus inaquosorum]
MSNSTVRQLITKHVEEEVLIELLGDEFLTASEDRKNRIISGAQARELIDLNVERIINTFLQDIQKGSPDAKRAKRYNIYSAIISLVGSAALAHAVNLENLPYISFCIIVLVGLQIYSIFKGF